MVKAPDSPRLPREEKSARVPSLLPAPTEITHGACAYGLWVFSAEPSLPAANTLTMPFL